MNGTGPGYTEADLHSGLSASASASEKDFDALLTGMADRAMTQGRHLTRRRRATIAGTTLAVLGVTASAVFFFRPAPESAQPALPPPPGITTREATALLAYNATCFDGPAGQPSLTTYVWNPVSKQYGKTPAGPTIAMSPDGGRALLNTGITQDGTTTYAVASWPAVAAGQVSADAYRRVSSQVSLRWAKDGEALIDTMADRTSGYPGSVDFYDAATFKKTTVPLPQAVVDLTKAHASGGPWHITDISGTASDFAVTVVSKDYKQIRVISSTGLALRTYKLPSIPGHIAEYEQPRLAFSPDGRYLALWAGTGVAVYDLATSSNRLIFHTAREATQVQGGPDPQAFDPTGWTADDQLLGVIRWSTSGGQQRDVHQQLTLLTPDGAEVDSVEVSVPGDTKRVCTLYTATIAPAADYPSATKV